MTKQPPAIDFASLSYPSDRITIEIIRARNPRGFAQEDPNFFHQSVRWGERGDFGGLLFMERIAAHKAFAARLGLPDPHDNWDHEELVDVLSEEYENYNVSRGLWHTKLMVRDLEAQAVAQAERYLGKGR
jgi:hypothetical protein